MLCKKTECLHPLTPIHLLERVFLNGPFAILLHNILYNEADQILSFGLVCDHLPISFLLVDIFLNKRFNCPWVELSGVYSAKFTDREGFVCQLARFIVEKVCLATFRLFHSIIANKTQAFLLNATIR